MWLCCCTKRRSPMEQDVRDTENPIRTPLAPMNGMKRDGRGVNPNVPFDSIGITILGIKDFIEKCGGSEVLCNKSCREVWEKFISVMTTASDLSYCHQQMSLSTTQSNPFIHKASNYYLSYAGKLVFLDVVLMIDHYFEDKVESKDAAVIHWDLFSTIKNNQIVTAPADSWLSYTFVNGLKDIGRILFVIEPLDTPVTFTRTWCLFELFLAIKQHIPIDLIFTPTSQKKFNNLLKTKILSIYDIFDEIDIRKGESNFPADGVAINSYIFKAVGHAKFNHSIIDFLKSWLLAYTKTLYDTQIKISGVHDNDTIDCLFSLVTLYTIQHLQVDIIRHIESFFEIYRTGTTSSQPQNAYMGSKILALKRKLAFAYFSTDQINLAESLSQECLQLNEAFYGRESKEYYRSKYNLASLFISQNKNDDAEEMLVEIIAKQSYFLGLPHTHTIDSLKLLGVLYHLRSEYAKATEFYRKVLEYCPIQDYIDEVLSRNSAIDERNLNLHSSDLRRSSPSLRVLDGGSACGTPQGALNKNSSSRSTGTASSNNLTELSSCNGEGGGSGALSIIYGEYKHEILNYLETLQNYATLLTALDKSAEAVQYLQRGIEIQMKLHGLEQNVSFGLMLQLGNVLKKMEQFEKSEKVFLNCYTLQLKSFAEDSLECMVTRNKLGELYIAWKDYKRAETVYLLPCVQMCEENILKYKEMKSSEHMKGSGTICVPRYSELETEDESLQFQRRSSFGPFCNDMNSKICKGKRNTEERITDYKYQLQTACEHLVTIYVYQHYYESAQKYSMKRTELCLGLFGEKSSETLRAARSLGNIYCKLGLFAESEKILLNCLKHYMEKYGPNNSASPILETEYDIGALYNYMKRYADSALILENMLMVLLPIHPDAKDALVLKAMCALATSYFYQHRTMEAEKLFIDCYQKQRSFLGNSHEDTLFTLSAVFELYQERGLAVPAEFTRKN